MSDPAALEGMMGMMKGNMAMMIPQSLIMGWINAFFSGFVISEFILFLHTLEGVRLWRDSCGRVCCEMSPSQSSTNFTGRSLMDPGDINPCETSGLSSRFCGID
jgi:hypothetical protein